MGRWLIDLSAWAHSRHPEAIARWRALVEGDQLVCHPVFAVEMLHSAIDPKEFGELQGAIEKGFDWVWPDEQTARLAMAMQQRMASVAPTGQRVRTPDLLTAALAVQHRIGVLHYDADYDTIGERGGEPFESEWLAPKGSLETGTRRATKARRVYRKALGERMIQFQGDVDLAVWPKLIEWLDTQLRERGIEPPPPPRAP